MRIDFEGRPVVVTGGTGALGASVLELLLGAGAVCHVPSRSAGSADKLPRSIRGRVHVVHGVDVEDERSLSSFYAGLPGLWASIHCAGGFTMSRIEDISLEAFSGMLSVNAASCFACCREAVKKMRRSATATAGREGRGRIVNVASQQALEPRRGAGMVAYTASKAAVAALTQALAEEVAKEGIWVNAVVPSIMNTDANRKAMPDADASAWATTAEVAATIAFLASPQNTSTRGALVTVYGRS